MAGKLSVATLAALLFSASTGAAQMPLQDAAQGGGGGDGPVARTGFNPGALSLNVELFSSVGVGTFVANPNARNEYWDWNLTLAPAWRIDDSTTLSARATIFQELTESDSTTFEQQLLLADIFLNLSRRMFTIPGIDVAVSGFVRLYFPTSLISQNDDLTLGARLGLNFVRAFGPLTVIYGFQFHKNFHRNTRGLFEVPRLQVRGGDFREGDSVSFGGNNVSYQIRNLVALSLNIVGDLSMSASYLFIHGCLYESFQIDDGLASPYAQGNRCERDISVATLDLSYAFNKHLSIVGGILGQTLPRNNSNRVVFPWYPDASRQALNLTSFYVQLTGSFDGADF